MCNIKVGNGHDAPENYITSYAFTCLSMIFSSQCGFVVLLIM